jgi:drug/metabolite transporter (DMT)-like permease
MSDPSLPPTARAPGRLADPRLLVPLGLGTLYLVWGSTYLGIRIAVGGWPPFLLAGVRFLIAGSLLFGFLRLRGMASPTWRQWRNAAVVGVLLLGLGNGLVCYAEREVSSGIAAVAVASMPLFMALFGLRHGHRPNALEATGLVIGFVGVVVLNLGGDLSGSRLAALALLLAAAAWAFGSVWSKHQEMPPGPMNTAAQMLCGCVALFAMGFASGERLPAHPPLAANLALAYLVVFGSLIGYSAYLYVLRHARPVLATSYAYVNPPVAVLFGVLLAGEHVGVLEIAGTAIILCGVAAITLAQQKRVG